jgi:hypothetical protein
MVLTTPCTQVGPRSASDRERFPPNNILLVLAGAGLLWLGWTGFNGGDPYSANIDSSMAVLNTHICASTSLLVWTLLDVFFFGKPSVIGAVQGMITGLVCITPGAGEQPSPPSVGNWTRSTKSQPIRTLQLALVIYCHDDILESKLRKTSETPSAIGQYLTKSTNNQASASYAFQALRSIIHPAALS